MNFLKKILLTGLMALAMSLILPASSDARVVIRIRPQPLRVIKTVPLKTVIVSSPSVAVVKVKTPVHKTWVPGHYRKGSRQQMTWIPGHWVTR